MRQLLTWNFPWILANLSKEHLQLHPQVNAEVTFPSPVLLLSQLGVWLSFGCCSCGLVLKSIRSPLGTSFIRAANWRPCIVILQFYSCKFIQRLMIFRQILTTNLKIKCHHIGRSAEKIVDCHRVSKMS